MSRNIGHLTWKARDKDTDYNETVYNWELNKLLFHLQGAGDLEYSTQNSSGPDLPPEPGDNLARRRLLGRLQQEESVQCAVWSVLGQVTDHS